MALTLEHKEILRDIRLKLKDAQSDGLIIPEIVFEIINNVEDEYNG